MILHEVVMKELKILTFLHHFSFPASLSTSSLFSFFLILFLCLTKEFHLTVVFFFLFKFYAHSNCPCDIQFPARLTPNFTSGCRHSCDVMQFKNFKCLILQIITLKNWWFFTENSFVYFPWIIYTIWFSLLLVKDLCCPHRARVWCLQNGDNGFNEFCGCRWELSFLPDADVMI